MFNQGDQPIAGYRLQRFLGRGQFGEVWAADGPGGTLIALKFIALQQKTGIRELKSVQAVKRIKHANLCSVNAMWLLGEDGGVLDDQEIDLLIKSHSAELPSQTMSLEATQTLHNPRYLVVSMALADGSLDQKLKEAEGGGIPREQLIDYMQQAARGIDHLNAPRHQVGDKVVGIQHRDIKPANLLFAGDSVLVGDFGVAAAFGEYDTEATSVVGSLCYMSPESIKRIPSHASDQYALAITYYQLRTGQLPFEPTVSFAELVDIHVRGKLRFELVSQHEQTVLSKATATDARQRYASCVEFVNALAAPAPQNPPADGFARFKFPAMIGGSLAMIFLIAAVMWGVLGGAESTDAGGNQGKLESHTLVFSPERTHFEIDIIPAEPRDNLETQGVSSILLKLLPTDTLHIVARSENPLYAPVDQQYTYEQLVRDGWSLSLSPLPVDAILDQVSQKASEGPWEEAAALFQQAIPLRPEIAAKPREKTVYLNAAPAVVASTFHETRLITALSGDSASSLAVLNLENWEKPPVSISLNELPYHVYLLGDTPSAVSVGSRTVMVTPIDNPNASYQFDLGQHVEIDYRQITASAIAPDGRSLVFGQVQQKLTLLQRQSDGHLDETGRSAFPTRVDAVAFTPDNAKVIAVGASGNGMAWPLVDVSDNSAQTFRLAGLDEQVLALHPVTAHTFYAISDNQVLLASIPESGTETQVELIEELRSALVSSRLTADRKFLVYSTQNEARPLSILDTATHQTTSIRPPEIRGMVEDFDLSPDSQRIVYADTAGALFTVDLQKPSATPLPLLPSQNERVKFVRVSKDGLYVITITESGKATRWNLIQLLLRATAENTSDDSQKAPSVGG